MIRTYTRPTCEDGKQRQVPVGWWCRECGISQAFYHSTSPVAERAGISQ